MAVQNITVSDAATNSVTSCVVVTHNTTGTPAAGFGTGILLRGQDASKTAGGDNLASIEATLIVATAGAEVTGINFLGRSGGGVLTKFWYMDRAAGSAQFNLGVTDGTRNAALIVDGSFGYVGTVSAHTLKFITSGSSRWTLDTSGILAIVSAGGYIDLSAITAGSPNLKINATSDTPTVAFTGGGSAPTTAPAGYIEILVGASARYIPFWA